MEKEEYIKTNNSKEARGFRKAMNYVLGIGAPLILASIIYKPISEIPYSNNKLEQKTQNETSVSDSTKTRENCIDISTYFSKPKNNFSSSDISGKPGIDYTNPYAVRDTVFKKAGIENPDSLTDKQIINKVGDYLSKQQIFLGGIK